MNVLLSAAFVLCWSSGFIGAKLGAGSASAVTVLMRRFLPLTVVLIAVALTVTRAAWRGLAARDVARQAVIGALSQSGYLLTVYYAIQLGVSTGTTALIDGVQPLVAGALAGPLLHQYVSRGQWLGLGLGAAVVLGRDRLARRAVHLRRVRAVLADPAALRSDRGQHAHVPHGAGHGGVGSADVR